LKKYLTQRRLVAKPQKNKFEESQKPKRFSITFASLPLSDFGLKYLL